ncbi:MAG: winged helix-turn-helix transcriptional regulator [Rhodococcus sp.]|nr:winged helix-turn-helix transcriptional regulator [Rhodococcus sp. (in: high G+C Gram-positive bacteria)]
MTARPHSELASVFAALSDETRWEILTELGRADLSASSLATRLPVSRQAIAKHLNALQACGLVESVKAGREIRYRALGAELDKTARTLEQIGAEWDRRLVAIREIAESADE